MPQSQSESQEKIETHIQTQTEGALPVIPAAVQLPASDKSLSAKALADKGNFLYKADGADWHDLLPARYITTAIKKQPDCNSFYNDLAGFYWWQQGHLSEDLKTAAKEKCLAVYNAAIKRFPEEADNYHGRSTIYTELRKKTEALSDSETALRLHPNDVDFHLSHGACLAAVGQYSKALQEFEKYIGANNQNYLFTMGSCYQSLKQYDKLLQFSNQWIARVGLTEELLLLKPTPKKICIKPIRLSPITRSWSNSGRQSTLIAIKI